MKNLFITILTLTLPLALPAASQPSVKPNILIILADDMGYSDLGAMGGDAETPNLDKKEKNGVLLPNFYNNAKCAPSRASLMTGLSPQRIGADHGAGDVTRGAMTIAEALKSDYTTLMVGKWHIKPEPLELGFQRYFGAGLSAIHWWPTDKKEAAKVRLDARAYTEKDMTVPLEEWFMGIEHTNYAIKFLQEEVANKGKTKPFFLYYSSHLPHWSLQAPRADVERYLNVFKTGTDVARQRRYDRMVERGIINPKATTLSPLAGDAKPWASLSAEEKSYYEQTLAIHAAMVDRLDQELGRLFDCLKKNGLFDNTAIFFMSDNGASGEGSYSNYKQTANSPRLGDRGTDGRILDQGAAMSNTPMRGAKSTLYEGGIGTPLIFHWPQGIGQPGLISQQVGHLIDLFPTILDMAGLSYPADYAARKIHPLDGKSLLPVFKGGAVIDRTIYWDYEKFAAMRQGNWKLLRVATKGKDSANATWQLYDLAADRTELNDVSKANPEVVKTMAKQWDTWCSDVKKEAEAAKGDKAPKDKSAKKDKKDKGKPAEHEEG